MMDLPRNARRKVFQMTREATKKKRDKKRAQKKKHAHQTEHMAEEVAREKRSHTEEIIAIVVLLIFVPFMVTGIIWWPASTGTGKVNVGTGLADGSYSAGYLGTRPSSDSAASDSAGFFGARRGELI